MNTTPEKPITDPTVIREYLTLAGGLKFAAYRVRSPGAVLQGWSDLQFHLTYMPQQEIEGRTVVDDGAVAVCAVVPERIAVEFIKFVERIAVVEAEVSSDIPYATHGAHYEFLAYKRADGNLEYQIRSGPAILAIMLSGMAKMFCTLVKRALAPKPQAVAPVTPVVEDAPLPGRKRRIKCPLPEKSRASKLPKNKKKGKRRK